MLTEWRRADRPGLLKFDGCSELYGKYFVAGIPLLRPGLVNRSPKER
jgi:hypothetical protein